MALERKRTFLGYSCAKALSLRVELFHGALCLTNNHFINRFRLFPVFILECLQRQDLAFSLAGESRLCEPLVTSEVPVAITKMNAEASPINGNGGGGGSNTSGNSGAVGFAANGAGSSGRGRAQSSMSGFAGAFLVSGD